MKGIITQPEGVYCGQCKHKIADTLHYKENFCSHCGNPISETGFQQNMQQLIDIKMEQIKTIEHAMKEGMTVENILKDLKDELKE